MFCRTWLYFRAVVFVVFPAAELSPGGVTELNDAEQWSWLRFECVYLMLCVQAGGGTRQSMKESVCIQDSSRILDPKKYINESIQSENMMKTEADLTL